MDHSSQETSHQQCDQLNMYLLNIQQNSNLFMKAQKMVMGHRRKATHPFKIEMFAELYPYDHEMWNNRIRQKLLLVQSDGWAVTKEIGDIGECEKSSIVAQTGPSLSENGVTQYADLFNSRCDWIHKDLFCHQVHLMNSNNIDT